MLVGVAAGFSWVDQVAVGICVLRWSCLCLLIEIACGVWRGMVRWSGLVCHRVLVLVVGFGLKVVVSVRMVRLADVVALMVLVAPTGFCW